MVKFRTRLVLSLLSLISLVLIALGILLGQMFKGYYLQSLNERLEKEAAVMAYELNSKGGIDQLQLSELDAWSERLKITVTIVRMDGAVLYDSGNIDDRSPARHEEIIKNIVSSKNSSVYHENMANKDEVLYRSAELRGNAGEKAGLVILSTETDEFNHIYQQIWNVLLVSLGASLIIIILVGTKITNRYTKPIESATTVAIELAKGNYRARSSADTQDEVGMLNTSINILARNLQDMMHAQENHQDRLTTIIENIGSGLLLIDDRGFIVMVNRSFRELLQTKKLRLLKKRYHEALPHKEVIDIIEEVFMTEKNIKKELVLSLEMERRHFEVSGAPIIGTNDEWKGILIVFHNITEIKKLEQIRKDFVANVSHELKTPITSIKGFTETLLDGALNDPEALRTFLSIILKESERMQTLVKDLLELSNIEQKGFTLNIEKVEINSMIEEIVETLDKRIEKKKIQLSLSMEENLMVEGDVYRLKQVFYNLITNAILYVREHGVISLKAYEERECVIVEVKDNGIGIAKEEIPRIFERFYRVDKARSRESGGTGLGLAIVKHIIEAHKAKILVESEVDKGTTFKVKLSKEIDKSLKDD